MRKEPAEACTMICVRSNLVIISYNRDQSFNLLPKLP